MSVEAVGQRNVVSTAGRPVWTAAVLLVIPAIMVNIVERALCGAERPAGSTPQHDNEGIEEMQAPAPNFAVDIKPLFRERDRRAMTFLFDLWDYEAVKENAEAILAATEGGDMPCDGAWPVERVSVLRRWIEGGCQP
jgi:hypothetical protein